MFSVLIENLLVKVPVLFLELQQEIELKKSFPSLTEFMSLWINCSLP